MTGDLKLTDNTWVASGAPVTGDEITANDSAYPINTFYIDKTNGSSYVRTGVSKVTGDWTAVGAGITLDPDSPESVTLVWAGSQAEYDGLTPVATTLYFIV